MAAFYAEHTLWAWMIVAGVILAIEVVTGSGWLLWPAACAAAIGLLSLLNLPIGMAGEVAAFSILTIATTLLARRFIPDGRLRPGPDINNRMGDLVGQRGRIIGAFLGREGRVLVDGSEWDAEMEGEAPVGDMVEVVSVLGGARLRVRAV